VFFEFESQRIAVQLDRFVHVPDLKDDVTNVGNKSGQGLVLFVRGGSGLFLVLKDISREIRESVEQLSEFLGAKVVYSRKVPEYWHTIFTRFK